MLKRNRAQLGLNSGVVTVKVLASDYRALPELLEVTTRIAKVASVLLDVQV
jgi:hypothetical protein